MPSRWRLGHPARSCFACRRRPVSPSPIGWPLSVRAERSDVRLRGGAGRRAWRSFELTEGRGAGVAYLWGASGEVALSARLRATFTYDARLPEARPLIQTVRMQVQALF